MPRSLVLVVFVLGLLGPASARAQDGVLVLHAGAEPSQAAQLASWVQALRAQASDVVETRALDPQDCWPQDAACAAQLVGTARAGRILLVRVLWERAGCVPMRDASGARTGHRMLRRAVLDLTLLDAQGHTLAHQTRPAEVADPSERTRAAAELTTALGLSR